MIDASKSKSMDDLIDAHYIFAPNATESLTWSNYGSILRKNH